jgi:hypothetical protein
MSLRCCGAQPWFHHDKAIRCELSSDHAGTHLGRLGYITVEWQGRYVRLLRHPAPCASEP